MRRIYTPQHTLQTFTDTQKLLLFDFLTVSMMATGDTDFCMTRATLHMYIYSTTLSSTHQLTGFKQLPVQLAHSHKYAELSQQMLTQPIVPVEPPTLPAPQFHLSYESQSTFCSTLPQACMQVSCKHVNTTSSWILRIYTHIYTLSKSDHYYQQRNVTRIDQHTCCRNTTSLHL
jgi:hypothetical protein